MSIPIYPVPGRGWARAAHYRRARGRRHLRPPQSLHPPLGQTRRHLLQCLQRPVNDTSAIYTRRMGAQELRRIFCEVEAIFSDLDGTLMEDPRAFSPAIAAGLRRLNDVGVVPTFLTGKPLSEARGVLEMLRPYGVIARMMFEKGAYELIGNGKGEYRVEDLLATREIEGVIADLKQEFWNNSFGIRQILERRYGIGIVRAGDGTHKCIFSIDVFEAGKRIEDSRDPHRMDVKVDIRQPAVREMIAALRADIADFVDARFKGCTVDDLGNANLEITVRRIEKHLAIAVTRPFQEQRPILLWGDSGNDEHMMRLRRRSHVHVGVVFHEATPAKIVRLGHFYALGRGNGAPFIDAVVEAKK